MKILVTGSHGFIGSHLVERLINDGHIIVAIDDLSTGKEENLSKISDGGDLQFIRADIADFNFDSLEGIEMIFNLGARARIQPSIIDPVPSDLTNIHGTLRVFDFARRNNIPVVHSSSSSIYGVSDELKEPIREDHSQNLKNPYALQKMVNELYLRMFEHLYGLKYVALRYFNVYGERQLVDGPYATVIGIFLDQYKKGEKFTIVGDGDQKRDFTYVKDVVEANIKAMEYVLSDSYDSQFPVFNIGTGTNHTINRLAEIIDKEHPFENLEERQGEARETKADISKANKQLWWMPTKRLEDWLSDQAEQIRQSNA